MRPAMAVIRPFQAVRPRPDTAAAVAAVPYDVVNREEAAKLAEGNPHSFLHVSRSEIDLEPGIDPYADAVYSKAKSNYDRLQQDGVLVTEAEPSLYAYQIRSGNHTQVGLAAAFSVDEYDQGKILKHEKTRKDKEDDRTRHILTLRAQTGPVLLTFRPVDSIAKLLEEAVQGEPLYQVKADDGTEHTLWKVADPQAWVKAFEAVPSLYIADGHHRAAGASRARAELAKNPGWTGQEEGNFFLAVAFPTDQLRILPYDRLVKDLNGLTPHELRSKLHPWIGAKESPDTRGHCSMYLEGQWLNVDMTTWAKTAGSPVGRLDVALLQEHVLERHLGIGDPRVDKRIDFLGGGNATTRLARLVDDGKAAVAFSMYPTSLEQLLEISDAGEIMPPKSTWFDPKLRDAMVIHSI